MASQVDDCEHLLQPSDLSLGFHAVFFKGGFQLSVLSRLRHLRQRGQYFLFREVNVLKRVRVFGSLAMLISYGCAGGCTPPDGGARRDGKKVEKSHD
jgi:hypothetical protein